jgi:hypothetical protein
LVNETKEEPKVCSTGRGGEATDGLGDAYAVAIVGEMKTGKVYFLEAKPELITVERDASFLTLL